MSFHVHKSWGADVGFEPISIFECEEIFPYPEEQCYDVDSLIFYIVGNFQPFLRAGCC